MGKRIVYTKITPLPSNVPRQLAIELLHSHEEVIELNPLVTGVKSIEAPRDAPNDEYFSQWYEISEIITWGFGLRKKIAFKGVFHNQPYGLQSHVYAPFGVDLRNKYSIGGNQPGEPRKTRELGVDTPQDGLYLREDVEIVCNLALASFVKKETKEATGKMIQRLARKAELLDEGKLHAMFENGRLKTSKPSGQSDTDGSQPTSSPPGSPSPSMMSGFAPPRTPRLDKKGFGNYHDVAIARQQSQHSQHSRASQYLPVYQQSGYGGPEYGQAAPGAPMPMINELPASFQYTQHSPGLQPGQFKPQQEFRSELPGDSSFSTGTPSPQPSPNLAQPDTKPPGNQYRVHEYQAYPPPTQQHPADRDHRNSSLSAPGSDYGRSNSYGGQGSNIADWQQVVSNSSQVSVGRQSPYDQTSRPSSNLVPDHQRFSQLSIQQTPPQESSRPASQNYARTSASTKCPVCGLFEGDEAAVSHHVSKAHFT
ncbi:hypothetical protein M409DRAFT_24770 [Zasmidium cellare ATCC 36951]|uniref:DUF7053 domain-containing protein n=1 Tax=Zasmidium cellare ATCC 36951 TaxID=1080233 RepID=A0A6A6CCR8_ZASCE|nr:uncharacterized protein M409DRAFT_24770 [Zasmidium cellare ATCC 36951]KAF2164865.1 hypothetical protein M409DRAFT_24770 [Zasmidium cellare ATCC 36951]